MSTVIEPASLLASPSEVCDGPAVGLVPAHELVELCAQDTELYGRTFFPQTFRQSTPRYHQEIFEALDNPKNRYLNLQVFRDGAKTSLLRVFVSKRIAYGISRTILFVSASQGHSEKSIQWLRKAVEHNTKWTSVFGIKRGVKWNDEQLEFWHEALGISITVVPLGITGQVRGINIDDYRPDLIVLDDPCNEENTATPEQRKKVDDLVFGALEKSLTPRSEAPDAKMALAQTPLNAEDLTSKCERDSQWITMKFGCFDELGQSSWPERYPTEELLADKQAHANRQQLALWLREKECILVTNESSRFQGSWLKYWETLPDRMVVYFGIDPVPPPSDKEIATGFARKDFEVISVVGVAGAKFFLLEVSANQGHDPDWTITEFFRLVDKWRPLKVRLDSTAYQRTLKWILEKAMKERRRYVQINAVTERRTKDHRITQAYSGLASSGMLYVHSSQLGFQSQFISYPNVAHDDILDSVAMALDEAASYPIGNDFSEEPETEEEALPVGWRGAP